MNTKKCKDNNIVNPYSSNVSKLNKCKIKEPFVAFEDSNISKVSKLDFLESEISNFCLTTEFRNGRNLIPELSNKKGKNKNKSFLGKKIKNTTKINNIFDFNYSKRNDLIEKDEYKEILFNFKDEIYDIKKKLDNQNILVKELLNDYNKISNQMPFQDCKEIIYTEKIDLNGEKILEGKSYLIENTKNGISYLANKEFFCGSNNLVGENENKEELENFPCKILEENIKKDNSENKKIDDYFLQNKKLENTEKIQIKNDSEFLITNKNNLIQKNQLSNNLNNILIHGDNDKNKIDYKNEKIFNNFNEKNKNEVDKDFFEKKFHNKNNYYNQNLIFIYKNFFEYLKLENNKPSKIIENLLSNNSDLYLESNKIFFENLKNKYSEIYTIKNTDLEDGNNKSYNLFEFLLKNIYDFQNYDISTSKIFDLFENLIDKFDRSLVINQTKIKVANKNDNNHLISETNKKSAIKFNNNFVNLILKSQFKKNKNKKINKNNKLEIKNSHSINEVNITQNSERNCHKEISNENCENILKENLKYNTILGLNENCKLNIDDNSDQEDILSNDSSHSDIFNNDSIDSFSDNDYDNTKFIEKDFNLTYLNWRKLKCQKNTKNKDINKSINLKDFSFPNPNETIKNNDLTEINLININNDIKEECIEEKNFKMKLDCLELKKSTSDVIEGITIDQEIVEIFKKNDEIKINLENNNDYQNTIKKEILTNLKVDYTYNKENFDNDTDKSEILKEFYIEKEKDKFPNRYLLVNSSSLIKEEKIIPTENKISNLSNYKLFEEMTIEIDNNDINIDLLKGKNEVGFLNVISQEEKKLEEIIHQTEKINDCGLKLFSNISKNSNNLDSNFNNLIQLNNSEFKHSELNKENIIDFQIDLENNSFINNKENISEKDKEENINLISSNLFNNVNINKTIDDLVNFPYSKINENLEKTDNFSELKNNAKDFSQIFIDKDKKEKFTYRSFLIKKIGYLKSKNIFDLNLLHDVDIQKSLIYIINKTNSKKNCQKDVKLKEILLYFKENVESLNIEKIEIKKNKFFQKEVENELSNYINISEDEIENKNNFLQVENYLKNKSLEEYFNLLNLNNNLKNSFKINSKFFHHKKKKNNNNKNKTEIEKYEDILYNLINNLNDTNGNNTNNNLNWFNILLKNFDKEKDSLNNLEEEKFEIFQKEIINFDLIQDNKINNISINSYLDLFKIIYSLQNVGNKKIYSIFCRSLNFENEKNNKINLTKFLNEIKFLNEKYKNKPCKPMTYINTNQSVTLSKTTEKMIKRERRYENKNEKNSSQKNNKLEIKKTKSSYLEPKIFENQTILRVMNENLENQTNQFDEGLNFDINLTSYLHSDSINNTDKNPKLKNKKEPKNLNNVKKVLIKNNFNHKKSININSEIILKKKLTKNNSISFSSTKNGKGLLNLSDENYNKNKNIKFNLNNNFIKNLSNLSDIDENNNNNYLNYNMNNNENISTKSCLELCEENNTIKNKMNKENKKEKKRINEHDNNTKNKSEKDININDNDIINHNRIDDICQFVCNTNIIKIDTEKLNMLVGNLNNQNVKKKRKNNISIKKKISVKNFNNLNNKEIQINSDYEEKRNSFIYDIEQENKIQKNLEKFKITENNNDNNQYLVENENHENEKQNILNNFKILDSSIIKNIEKEKSIPEKVKNTYDAKDNLEKINKIKNVIFSKKSFLISGNRGRNENMNNPKIINILNLKNSEISNSNNNELSNFESNNQNLDDIFNKISYNASNNLNSITKNNFCNENNHQNILNNSSSNLDKNNKFTNKITEDFENLKKLSNLQNENEINFNIHNSPNNIFKKVPLDKINFSDFPEFSNKTNNINENSRNLLQAVNKMNLINSQNLSKKKNSQENLSFSKIDLNLNLNLNLNVKVDVSSNENKKINFDNEKNKTNKILNQLNKQKNKNINKSKNKSASQISKSITNYFNNNVTNNIIISSNELNEGNLNLSTNHSKNFQEKNSNNIVNMDIDSISKGKTINNKIPIYNTDNTKKFNNFNHGTKSIFNNNNNNSKSRKTSSIFNYANNNINFNDYQKCETANDFKNNISLNKNESSKNLNNDKFSSYVINENEIKANKSFNEESSLKINFLNNSNKYSNNFNINENKNLNYNINKDILNNKNNIFSNINKNTGNIYNYTSFISGVQSKGNEGKNKNSNLTNFISEKYDLNSSKIFYNKNYKNDDNYNFNPKNILNFSLINNQKINVEENINNKINNVNLFSKGLEEVENYKIQKSGSETVTDSSSSESSKSKRNIEQNSVKFLKLEKEQKNFINRDLNIGKNFFIISR